MASEIKIVQLKTVSYNIHGFMQRYLVLEDFMKGDILVTIYNSCYKSIG